MKTILMIMIFTVTTAFAQEWLAVDTVTSGDFNDHNPQLDHGGLGTWRIWAPYEWLIFERQSDSGNSICAMKVKPSSAGSGSLVQWDASATTISQSYPWVPKEYPDICTNIKTFYTGTTDSIGGVTVAAWQENEGLRETTVPGWNIYYSYSSGNPDRWSAPQKLPGQGQNVIVRPLSDSSFILIWQADSVLLFSTFGNGVMTDPDTLVVTNYDSTEFDCEFIAYPQPTIAWTGKNSTGKVVCFAAKVTSMNPVTLSMLDTLSSDGNISKPRFIGSYPQSITFNVEKDGRFKAVLASPYLYYVNEPWQQVDLAADSLSDNLNPVGIMPMQVITENSRQMKNTPASFPPGMFGCFAWERQSSLDTSLVFASGTSSDTVASAGFNRSLSLSTYAFSESPYFEIYPCVWESNRTGLSHIYSRIAGVRSDAVFMLPYHDQTFALRQNYPNPFNPTTTINYQLSVTGNVTLKVYDVLGRLVATLISGRQIAGEHSASFDAKNLSSGVYFYQLKAGNLVETKKMLLEK